jgi:hypothetical protein
MVETMRFRLAPDADEAAFRAVDARVQVDFAYRQAGLMRRTTTRSDDGEWLVIDLWSSEEAASACSEAWDDDPVTNEFMSFIDPSTVQVGRYQTLD